MGIETVLFVAGLIMSSACDPGSRCANTGTTMWHIGLIMGLIEIAIVLIVAALGGRSVSRASRRDRYGNRRW